MAVIPPRTYSTVTRIFKLHEARRDEEVPRGYLGASKIGEKCPRRLWYDFRWCESGRGNLDGRMLRLFETGHLAEARLVAELRELGMHVEGQQHAVEACNGHFRGHLDGAVLGLEEAPKTWHVFECKTHSAKSFAELTKKGVKESKPVHYGQLVAYMGLTGMERAAYFAVNKDTDDLYMERVAFDRTEFQALIDKAQAVIDAAVPPDKISEDPAWYECKMCPHAVQCHGVAAPPAQCRTCAHSTPVAGGEWTCEYHGAAIPFDAQRQGCDEHRFIPPLVASFLDLESADGNVIVWRNRLNGAEVRQPDYSSREIHKASDKAFLGNDFANHMKATFPGAVVTSSTPPIETGDAPRSDLEPFYGSRAVSSNQGSLALASENA